MKTLFFIAAASNYKAETLLVDATEAGNERSDAF